jgi:ribonuclease J
MTREFVEKTRVCEPVALICEGTRMTTKEKRRNYSELQVEALSCKIVSSTDKAMFLARYSRDMDRFRSFYNVAKKNNRKLVIFPKTAYLLSKLVNDKRLSFPDPTRDESILVYFKRKKSGKFDERDYYAWERRFMDKMVTHGFVHKNQREVLMDLGFYQFAELIDIKPDRGSHFIHSMSEPFSEEDIGDRVMHNWLNHFGMHFHQLHASGHINRNQLTDFIDYIEPKRIFPVHTENQHLFKKINDNTQTIRREKEYQI